MEPRFVRNLDGTQIAKLSEASLFQEKLIPDIKSGVVFPAAILASGNVVPFRDITISVQGDRKSG